MGLKKHGDRVELVLRDGIDININTFSFISTLLIVNIIKYEFNC